ncbi:hypothetical protein N7493_000194 [Penicillium malachiteum]|uniref:Sister chromatid cohesion protein Dcc1 n=1 Tax=Penicillium malachiteum TaxID=1324776 RepID=A0AAD6N0T3_9EURO|nr:hypothetical protein N7493_000194 [Penicillium malachiteum]
MATQDTRAILLTHTYPQQGFRLLELTPELDALLSSADAPVLELKSPSNALAKAVPDVSGQEYVNLCTPTKTYRIRQVQSSNSLHLLRPSAGRISRADIKVVEEEAGESGALNLPDDSVSAIAKCGSTLELHTPPDGFSAVPFLEKSLRLYDRRSEDVDEDVMMEESDAIEDMGATGMQKVREQICADVPVSAEQCEQGWVDICAFVDAKSGLTGWRPSARMRLNVWKRILDGTILQGIDLEKQFLVEDLWKSVLDDDESEPFPRGLLEAVVRKLCTADERPALPDAIKWASLERVECSSWVGETYLAVTAPTASSAIGRSEFLQAWKDCLPESWRGEASLSKLQNGVYQSPDPTTIFFVEPSQRQQVAKAAAGSAAAAKAKPTRNWHELLKTQKRH